MAENPSSKSSKVQATDVNVVGVAGTTALNVSAGNVTIADNVTVSTDVTVKGTSTLGTRKFATFPISLADTNAATTAYAEDDVLVEVGTLDVTVGNTNLGTASKIFIHKAVLLNVTKAGQTLAGNLALSATTGTATNAAATSADEIVGAGVDSISSHVSASSAVTEIDIDLNAANGSSHVFTPNIGVAIAKKYLYLRTTTAINADITAGRYSVEVEYSIL